MPGDPSTAVAPLSVTMGDWRTRSRSVSLWEKGGSLIGNLPCTEHLAANKRDKSNS
ncbi:hypothetical protein [Tolypothrix sp. VBCCA 56010]|uniref:hypothetical protein n=1 Tax=Tolypothrix sp. VBCCA 56010 TaxID=3137731 RepID=UPI003D7C424E